MLHPLLVVSLVPRSAHVSEVTSPVSQILQPLSSAYKTYNKVLFLKIILMVLRVPVHRPVRIRDDALPLGAIPLSLEDVPVAIAHDALAPAPTARPLPGVHLTGLVRHLAVTVRLIVTEIAPKQETLVIALYDDRETFLDLLVDVERSETHLSFPVALVVLEVSAVSVSVAQDEGALPAPTTVAPLPGITVAAEEVHDA